jgi:hypothetical protein
VSLLGILGLSQQLLNRRLLSAVFLITRRRFLILPLQRP